MYTAINLKSLAENGDATSVRLNGDIDKASQQKNARIVVLPDNNSKKEDIGRAHRENTARSVRVANNTPDIAASPTVMQTNAAIPSETQFVSRDQSNSVSESAPVKNAKKSWINTPLYESKRPGVPFSSCDREIVHFQIGGAGNNFSHEYWRELCDEHGIWWDKHDKFASCHGQYYQDDESLYKLQQVSTMFYESSSGRYVPRAILMDLDSKFMDGLARTDLGRMYNPNNLIYNDAGSKNQFATARNVNGGPLVDASMDILFHEIEKLDSLQGITIGHSLGGGTGSGLTAGVLDAIDSHFGQSAFVQTYSLALSRLASDRVIEPYNAVLGIESQIEYSNQTVWFDNYALGKMCSRIQQIAVPEYIHNDTILAKVLAGITANLRFPGSMDADLRKMNTNLVPFPECKFLLAGCAPITASAIAPYKKNSVMDLALQMLTEENCILSCNPLRKGLLKAGYEGSNERMLDFDDLFLGLFGSWRGHPNIVTPSEIEECMRRIQQDVTGYRNHFPDWIPNLISSSMCSVMGVGETDSDISLSYVANTTAVMQSLDQTLLLFDSMLQKRVFVHEQMADGIEHDDMTDAREKCMIVRDKYIDKCAFTADPVSNHLQDITTDVTTEEQNNIIAHIKNLMEPKCIPGFSPSLLRASMRGFGPGSSMGKSRSHASQNPLPYSTVKEDSSRMRRLMEKVNRGEGLSAAETVNSNVMTLTSQGGLNRSETELLSTASKFRGTKGRLIDTYNSERLGGDTMGVLGSAGLNTL